MAIVYRLATETPLSATQVAGELHSTAQKLDLFDRSETAEMLLDEGALSRLGTLVRVVAVRTQPWQPVVTDLGFSPNVSVVFRQDKVTDTAAQTDDMTRLVSDLLDHIPGDAVLHFDYDYIMLLRRNGELTLHESDDIWPPDRLATIHQPYRRTTHAFS